MSTPPNDPSSAWANPPTPTDPQPAVTTAASELAKEVYEDMEVVIVALRRAGVPGADEAFERLVHRSARVSLNGVGRTAEAFRQAIPRFERLHYPVRDEEDGK